MGFMEAESPGMPKNPHPILVMKKSNYSPISNGKTASSPFMS